MWKLITEKDCIPGNSCFHYTALPTTVFCSLCPWQQTGLHHRQLGLCLLIKQQYNKHINSISNPISEQSSSYKKESKANFFLTSCRCSKSDIVIIIITWPFVHCCTLIFEKALFSTRDPAVQKTGLFHHPSIKKEL